MAVLVNTRLMKVETQAFDVGAKTKDRLTMIAVRGTDGISPVGALEFDDAYRSPAIVARNPEEVREAGQQLLDAARVLMAGAHPLQSIGTDALLSEPTTGAHILYGVDYLGRIVCRENMKGKPATREGIRRRLFDMLHVLDQLDQEEARK
ncbi:hypothetical protein [Burkholderia phage vB_BglM_WTB]